MAQRWTAPWGAEEPHTVCLLDPCCPVGRPDRCPELKSLNGERVKMGRWHE